MKFQFANSRLKRLYVTEAGSKKYPKAVVDSFFEVIAVIKSANSVQDLYKLKSLHFEKLKGDRKHQRSLKLNDKWRLIIEVEKDKDGYEIFIISIENHYGD